MVKSTKTATVTAVIVLLVFVVAIAGIGILLIQTATASNSSSSDNTSSGGKKYTLVVVVQPSNGGTVTPAGKTIWDQGKTVTLKQQQASGYKFSSWIINDKVFKESTLAVTMAANVTVIANFEKDVAAIVENVPIKFTIPEKPTKLSFSQGLYAAGEIKVARISGSGKIFPSVFKGIDGVQVGVGPNELTLSQNIETGSFKVIVADNGAKAVGTYTAVLKIEGGQQSEVVEIPIEIIQSKGIITVSILLDSKPVQDATVKVKDLSGTVLLSGVTSAGSIKFVDVKTGSYVVTADKDSFTASTTVTVSPERESSVPIIWTTSPTIGSKTGTLQITVFLNNEIVNGDVTILDDTGKQITGGMTQWSYMTTNLPVGTYKVRTAIWDGIRYQTDERPASVVDGQRTFLDIYFLKIPGEFAGLSIAGGLNGSTAVAGAIAAIVVVFLAVYVLGIGGLRKR